ncbi:zinc-binding dehydrogenase [Streptomyces sp. NEAU-YJ-81]|uniref:zinc-dependent alcohol dehydrogenase n=1 Tax=Streptomyces sp. NEAU-YJ-81 TaxID=2820288 RepID=UPI001ABBF7F1|nr:alcohol dehydrogenase catalytic domain-containing protein [Streptomyces sp. NEAU-YJ-81]MBO3675313.1 alcohol dehydrogenase catalytic domain-containing protein [Streptomyces sp. NEAU-YJ-81]
MADSMQSLWFVEPGRLEWREVPTPVLKGDADALVRPVIAGRCPLDVPILQGRLPVPPGYAIGHNAVAEVVAIGDTVTGVAVGDLVVVPPELSCGQCAPCLRGWTAHCTTVPYGATYGVAVNGHWGGLFDDLVRIPYADAMLHRIPAGVDPLECVTVGDITGHNNELARRHVVNGARKRVLVLAPGVTGLIQAALAIAYGAEYVLYVDPDPGNRALAEQCGAQTAAEPPGEADGLFDLTVEASGSTKWFHRGLSLLAGEGVFESLGGLTGEVPIPTWPMFLKGITMHLARPNSAANIPGALDAIATARIKPSAFYSPIVKWEDLPEAMLEPARMLVATR